jgi:hypothetical protein
MNEGSWAEGSVARELLGGISRMELHRRGEPGAPDYIVSKPREDGKPGRLWSVASMPPDAQKRYEELQQTAFVDPGPDAGDPFPDTSHQRSLFTRTPEESATDAAIHAARRKLSPSEDACAWPRFMAIAASDNHQYAVLGKTQKQHDEAGARQLCMSLSRFRHMRSDYLRTLKEQGQEAAYLSLVNRKPGPDKGSCGILAPWEKDYIKFLWEDSKRLPTRRQVWKQLLRHRLEKARALNGSFNYGEGPHESTVARYINLELHGDLNPKRCGAQAIKTSAGFIPRHFEDECAGNAWCIDEWELDCYCYRDDDHRVVYNWSSKNPIDKRGNPVLHVLSVIDERSTCVLDWIITDDLQDDTLTLVERILRGGHPVPFRLVADRAARFRQLSYGHMTQRSVGELVEALEGPLGRLGTVLRGCPEKNPRANRIERAIHREYARLAQRDLGLAWRPPLKSGLREVTGIDARVEAHYRYHCGAAHNSERAGEASELIPVSYVNECVQKWVDEINNAATSANGCHGLTRLAAFNHFRPPQEEVAKRRPPQAAIDEVFAERFTRRVPDHSMLSVDGDWYDAAELAYHIGEEVRILRYRRDFEQVFVECADNTHIVACRKPRVGIHDDRLAQESERLARRRKALAGAGEPIVPLAAFRPNLGQGIDNPHASLAPPPTPDREIGSPELMMRRTKTASAIADRWESEEA